MEGIKLIGMSLCVTTVATAIFSMLVPNQKLDKVLKFAISLFFLTGLISPFINNRLDFYIPPPEDTKAIEGTISAQAADSFLTIAQSRLEASLVRALDENGIKNAKVKTVLLNNHNGENIGISIEQLVVYIKKEDEKSSAEIVKLIKASAGVDPIIRIEGKDKKSENIFAIKE